MKAFAIQACGAILSREADRNIGLIFGVLERLYPERIFHKEGRTPAVTTDTPLL